MFSNDTVMNILTVYSPMEAICRLVQLCVVNEFLPLPPALNGLLLLEFYPLDAPARLSSM